MILEPLTYCCMPQLRKACRYVHDRVRRPGQADNDHSDPQPSQTRKSRLGNQAGHVVTPGVCLPPQLDSRCDFR
jgi:hypothetical protein